MAWSKVLSFSSYCIALYESSSDEMYDACCCIGVGKGMVGMVSKPVSGVIDMTSQTFKGISNTSTYFEHKTEIKPVRPQRAIYTHLELFDYAAAVQNVEYKRKKEAERISAGQPVSPPTSPQQPTKP